MTFILGIYIECLS